VGDAFGRAVGHDLPGRHEFHGSEWASHETIFTANALLAVYDDPVIFQINGPTCTGSEASRVFAVPTMDGSADLGRFDHKKPGIEVVTVRIKLKDLSTLMGHHATNHAGSATNAPVRVGFNEIVH
jgi:hypothetical protein